MMGEFSFERLRWWQKEFDRIDGYRLLRSEQEAEIRKNMTSIPAVRQSKGRLPYGMMIPIIDKAWGIQEINGTTQGVLITYSRSFTFYDFASQRASSFNYDQIADVMLAGYEVRIVLEDSGSIVIKWSAQTMPDTPEKSEYFNQIADFFIESKTAQSEYIYVENMRVLEFDTPSAQRYAQEGRIEEWVHRYLTSGGWANPDFSAGLKKEKRWWSGPIEVELAVLSRAVGTEPGMEYQVDEEYWHWVTSRLAQTLTDPQALPPLIVEYRQGELSVRDGNTRHGAMSLKGWSKCWVIIWYNSEQDYQQHISMLAGLDSI